VISCTATSLSDGAVDVVVVWQSVLFSDGLLSIKLKFAGNVIQGDHRRQLCAVLIVIATCLLCIYSVAYC